MDSIPGIQQAGASRKCFRCDSQVFEKQGLNQISQKLGHCKIG